MKRGRSGNAVIETAMWMPILFLLIVGMIQFGKLTYLDHVLSKIVYNAARNLATGQNLNFCDPADPATVAAVAAAISDPATGEPLITNLTADMLVVTTQCVDSTGVIGSCDVTGCQGVTGAQRPDFVTVAISGGYIFPLRIPYINLDPVVLRPSSTAPFGGSKL
ncbi:MAG TPA: TadE/TadG family type IV pilus assembly protein [Candidatus Solibacter sp.]|nr:TadE/TadG family type IV pilus assembly protein [Candidatus Solibacter sp.]